MSIRYLVAEFQHITKVLNATALAVPANFKAIDMQAPITTLQ